VLEAVGDETHFLRALLQLRIAYLVLGEGFRLLLGDEGARETALDACGHLRHDSCAGDDSVGHDALVGEDADGR
jgi:hypothetical protein